MGHKDSPCDLIRLILPEPVLAHAQRPPRQLVRSYGVLDSYPPSPVMPPATPDAGTLCPKPVSLASSTDFERSNNKVIPTITSETTGSNIKPTPSPLGSVPDSHPIMGELTVSPVNPQVIVNPIAVAVPC